MTKKTTNHKPTVWTHPVLAKRAWNMLVDATILKYSYTQIAEAINTKVIDATAVNVEHISRNSVAGFITRNKQALNDAIIAYEGTPNIDGNVEIGRSTPIPEFIRKVAKPKPKAEPDADTIELADKTADVIEQLENDNFGHSEAVANASRSKLASTMSSEQLERRRKSWRESKRRRQANNVIKRRTAEETAALLAEREQIKLNKAELKANARLLLEKQKLEDAEKEAKLKELKDAAALKRREHYARMRETPTGSAEEAINAELINTLEPIEPENGERNPCRLVDLRHDSCRWPIGKESGEYQMFCNKNKREGTSYCDGHNAVSSSGAKDFLTPEERKLKAQLHKSRKKPIFAPNY